MNIINSHYIPLKEPYDMLLAPDGRIYTQIGTLAVIEEAKKKKEGYGIVAHHHPVVISALQGVASTTIGEPNDEDDEVEVDYLVSPSNGEVLYQYESKSCHQLCTTDHREVDLSDFNTQILISYLDKTHEHPIDVGASIDYMQACGIHINFPESPDQEIELSMMEYGGIFYLQSSVFGLFFMVPFGKPDKKGEAHIDPQTLLMEFVNQARAYLKINPAYNFHFVSSSVHGMEDLINKDINDYLERPL